MIWRSVLTEVARLGKKSFWCIVLFARYYNLNWGKNEHHKQNASVFFVLVHSDIRGVNVHSRTIGLYSKICVRVCLQEQSKAEEQLVGQIRHCWRSLLTSALSGSKYTLISAESSACEPRPADQRVADDLRHQHGPAFRPWGLGNCNFYPSRLNRCTYLALYLFSFSSSTSSFFSSSPLPALVPAPLPSLVPAPLPSLSFSCLYGYVYISVRACIN